MSEILKLVNIRKSFKSGDAFLNILNTINFSIKRGESVAILGPSGAGKSTFLQVAALLDKPDSGAIFLNNTLASDLSDYDKTKLRGENIGFVYQFHNLLADFTVLENVMVPQLIFQQKKKEAKARAEELLRMVGLANRMHHNPKNLSGGEQQRVAIARALSNNPKLIIADEPTGNLDRKTAQIVFEIFLNIVNEKHTAVIMATHNVDLASCVNRILHLENGNLCS
jgi:lipoprotein-releasing system ATP-binding protein